MNSLTKKILNNFGANTISMALITSFQIIAIPIFIKFWGVDLYGEWLVLNAFTAYFSMTDIGINTATANAFSFNYTQGKFKKANILLNNNLFFILLSFVFILICLLFFICYYDFNKIFNLDLIDSKIAEIGIIVLFLQIFFGVLSNTLNTIYRAKGKFSRGMNIDNMIRLVEYLVTIFVIFLGYSILELVVSVLIVKVLAFFFKVLDSKTIMKYSIKIKYFSYKEFVKIIGPAVSFLSFPISNSILFQGYLLVINFILGSKAVVIFKTVRTMVYLIKAAIGLINKSLWPEFSIEYGRNNIDILRKLHRMSVKSSLLSTITLSMFLFIFGEHIYNFWIGEEVKFNKVLFHLFLGSIFLNSIWNSSVIVLQATNEHQSFSILYVILTLCSLLIAYLILIETKMIDFIPLSLYVTDVILIFYVFNKSSSKLDDNFSNLIISFRSDFKKISSYLK